MEIMHENFLDYYKLNKSTNDFKSLFTKKQSGKTCRFCNCSFPTVSFINTPHIIPELFGRNNMTSNFECDECNKKFQKFETDTSTMIQHYVSLLNIKTKKGVPTFQSIKNEEYYSTTLKSVNNQLNLNFRTNLSDFEYNEKEKTLTVCFRTKKFSPFSIYKIFLKIGISLLTDDEFEENNHFIDFLNLEEPSMNGMQVWNSFRYMLKTKYYKIPVAYLYRAKKTLVNNDVFPEYVLLICFSNIVFQFILPISNKNIQEYTNQRKLRIELFPSFLYDDIARLKAIEMYDLDLSEIRKISITDKVVLHYDRIDRDIKRNTNNYD